jgi:hypothetical protein
MVLDGSSAPAPQRGRISAASPLRSTMSHVVRNSTYGVAVPFPL